MLYPRFHDDSWWAYSPEFDSDTGPYSTEEQAQEWIEGIKSTKGADPNPYRLGPTIPI